MSGNGKMDRDALLDLAYIAVVALVVVAVGAYVSMDAGFFILVAAVVGMLPVLSEK